MSETGYRTFQEMIDDSSDEEDISVAIDTQENVVVPRHRTFSEMLNEDASDDPALEQEFLGQQAAEEYYFRTSLMVMK